MKKSTTAAVMSFVIPGAGLWCLGKRAVGMANLLVATAIIVLLAGVVSDQIHYVILAVAAGSAGLAHAIGSRYAKSDRRNGLPTSSSTTTDTSSSRPPFEVIDDSSDESPSSSDSPSCTPVARP